MSDDKPSDTKPPPINGTTNGSAAPAPQGAVELQTQLASYKTALVALLELVTRERNEYRTTNDQLLIDQVKRMLGVPTSRRPK